MAELKTPLELYKLLKKSNCGECRVPSCMAFAVAVVQGQKSLSDCPYLASEVIDSLSGKIVRQKTFEDGQEPTLKKLQTEVAKLDFAEAAARTGTALVNGRLAIPCLGKDFIIDGEGNLASPCHVNFWVHYPLLNYVLLCKGAPLSASWATIGQLKDGGEWEQFFAHRVCEAMRQLADAHTDFFFQILELFGAKPAPNDSGADQSLLIHPLPKVPFRINYWAPEEGIDSKLNILFDRSAELNIDPGSIYYLGRGLVEMFRQLILSHSKDGKLF